jgi:hypothetical protein
MNEGSMGNTSLFRKSLREWQAEFRRERGEQEQGGNGGTPTARTLRPGRMARRKPTERKGQSE